MNTTAPDATLTTSFTPTTAIGEIVDQLMVEKWTWSANHADYYAVCQPKECTYTVTEKNGAIYIMTTVIGLVGELLTVLKVLTLRVVVRIVTEFNRRRRNAVNDVVSHEIKSKKTVEPPRPCTSPSGREQD